MFVFNFFLIWFIANKENFKKTHYNRVKCKFTHANRGFCESFVNLHVQRFKLFVRITNYNWMQSFAFDSMLFSVFMYHWIPIYNRVVRTFCIYCLYVLLHFYFIFWLNTKNNRLLFVDLSSVCLCVIFQNSLVIQINAIHTIFVEYILNKYSVEGNDKFVELQ